MSMETTCFSLSHEGIYTWIHYNIERKSGWKPEEMIGHSFFDFLSKKEHEIILKEMGNQPTGRTQVYLVDAIFKDGSERPVRVSIRWFPENIVGSIDYEVTNGQYRGKERRDINRVVDTTGGGEPTSSDET